MKSAFFCFLGVIFAFGLFFLFNGAVKAAASKEEDWLTIVKDTCIYYNNNHVAFTSLEEWQGDLYLAFREAGSHEATSTDNGLIRVLVKKDDKWETQHVFYCNDQDLRDPCFVKWNDRFLVFTSYHYSELIDGKWTPLKRILHNASHHIYIWKIRPYKNELYGVGYCMGKWPLLLKSSDGENWSVIDEYQLGGDATEADLLFVKDKLYICFRIETPYGSNSMWGQSKYPFTDTKWTKMSISVDSPELTLYSKRTILLSGRECYYNKNRKMVERRVSLFAIDNNGVVKDSKIINAESRDQGYCSFCRQDKRNFIMSYYAGSTNNTKIRILSFRINESRLN